MDLIKAVLATRDELDPDLDAALLEAIVDAETDSDGEGDTAMRAIDKAVTAAIDRGVGLDTSQGGAPHDEQENGD
jgi:hypothetical protein